MFIVLYPFLVCIQQFELTKLLKWACFSKGKMEIPLLTIKVTKLYRKQQVWWDLAAIQNKCTGKVQGILAPKSAYNISPPLPPFIMVNGGFCLCAQIVLSILHVWDVNFTVAITTLD